MTPTLSARAAAADAVMDCARRLPEQSPWMTPAEVRTGITLFAVAFMRPLDHRLRDDEDPLDTIRGTYDALQELGILSHELRP